MTVNQSVSLITAGALAIATVLPPGPVRAAPDHPAVITDFSAQQKRPVVAPRAVAPRVAPRAVAPRVVAPRAVAPRVVAPRRVAPRVVTPSVVTPRAVVAPKVAPKVVAPSGAVVAPKVAPRVVTLSGANARTVTAARLRGVPASGAGRAVVRGQNFSAWRSGYRIRYGGGWRTFVALSALGAIAIGAGYFYPYAYLSAPEPLCEGLTEDGCQMMWQEVQTIEGDVISQCVAYCPWQ